MMKFKKIVSSLIVSTMIFSSIISASANKITTYDFQDKAIQEIVNMEEFPTTFSDTPAPIQGELLEPTVVGELQITETDIVENASYENTIQDNIGISPMLNNKYYWNYKTAYFEPSEM